MAGGAGHGFFDRIYKINRIGESGRVNHRKREALTLLPFYYRGNGEKKIPSEGDQPN